MRYKVVRCPSCVVCEPRTPDPKSQCPATDHGPRTTDVLLSAMSHSSRSHGSSVHQSPEVCQGPAARTTSPRTPKASTCTGRPSRTSTFAWSGGRNRRSAGIRDSGLGARDSQEKSGFGVRGSGFADEDGRPAAVFCESPTPSPEPRSLFANPEPRIPNPVPKPPYFSTWNRFIRNAPGRWVSTNSGEPTFPFPTTPAMRASVSSSFSGSGERGRNNPPCATRGFTGSAASVTFTTGAGGGSDCRFSSSSFKSSLELRVGTGKRMVDE